MARDAHREYVARTRLARERGFRSYWQQRRAPRVLRRVSDFGRLPESARESRSLAAEVINRARREGTSAEAAASELRVPMPVVRWWFPEALQPRQRGQTLPTGADRSLRLRPLAVEGEVAFVAVRGSRQAEFARRAFDTQWDFVHRRAGRDALVPFKGERIGGRLVETDPEVLERLANAGAFDLEELYRELVG